MSQKSPPGSPRPLDRPPRDRAEVIATKLSPELEREIDRRVRTAILAHLEGFGAAVQNTLAAELRDPRRWKDGDRVTFVGRVSSANRLRDAFTNRPTRGSTGSVWIGRVYVVQVADRASRSLLDNKGGRVHVEGLVTRRAAWEWPIVDATRVVALNDPPGGS